MRSLTLLLALSVVASSVVAQQLTQVALLPAACPLADSVLGLSPDKSRPVHGVIGIAQEAHFGLPDRSGPGTYGSIDPRIEMAAFPAPSTHAAQPAELLLTLSGDPAKKLGSAPPPVTASLILKDDTIYSLEGASPTVTGAPATGMAIAFVSFPLPAPMLVRLAGAKDAKLELLGMKVGLPKDLRRSAVAAYRTVLCGYVRAE